MRRTLVLAIVIAAAFLGWFLLRGDATTIPPAPRPVDHPAAANKSMERTRRADRRSAESPKEIPPPPPPERSAEKIPDADIGGELLVVDAATGTPLAGVNVGFMTFEPEPSPDVVKEIATATNLVDVVLKFGRVFASDAQGKVRLPTFKGTAAVAARFGELRGKTAVGPGVPKWRLELRRPTPLTGIVLNGDGQSCGGVMALLLQHTRFGDVTIAEQVTDAKDGVARFPDIAPDEGESEGTPSLTVALPLAERPSVDVDLKKPPTEPVRLVLPPTGRVRCEVVDDDDAAVPDGQVVLLRRRQDDKHELLLHGPPGKFDDARATTAGGAARFQYVGLGLELEVEAPSADGARATATQRFAGPKVAGEETVVRLTVGGRRPSFVGRLVDEQGVAVAECELVAAIVEPGHADDDGSENACTTDEGGRFRFTFDRSPGDASSAKLQIGRHVKLGGASYTTRRIALVDLPSVLPAGEIDVGDVVFQGTALLVSGVVVDATGKPLPGVTVCAMERGGRERRSPRRDVDAATSDAEGRFRLDGDASSSKQVFVGAGLEGHYAAEGTAFTAGTTDARIEMQEAGGIAGSVKLSDRAGRMEAEVHVLGDPADNGDADYRFHGDGLSVLVGADGAFEICTLAPGKARVEIRLGMNKADTILAVDDVEVVAGEVTRDPRLQGVDPTRSFRELKVVVTDADNKPVTAAVVHFRPVRARAFWKAAGSTDVDGVSNVQAKADDVSAGGLDLVVNCRGYRSAALHAVRTDVAVALDRAKQSVVTVRLASGSPLPEPPFQLSASLRWIDPGVADDAASQRNDPRDVYGSDKKFATDQILTFKTSDAGRYRVELILWKMDMGGAGGGGIETVPNTVVVTVGGDGTPAEVSVGVDPQTLKERMSHTR